MRNRCFVFTIVSPSRSSSSPSPNSSSSSSPSSPSISSSSSSSPSPSPSTSSSSLCASSSPPPPFSSFRAFFAASVCFSYEAKKIILQISVFVWLIFRYLSRFLISKNILLLLFFDYLYWLLFNFLHISPYIYTLVYLFNCRYLF